MNKSRGGFQSRGNRSSFKRTNKLLNKHGKAYRRQDVKQGNKRKYEEQSTPEVTTEQRNGTQEQAVISQNDFYSELIGSLKKRPRAYYEELLGESSEGEDSGGEGELEDQVEGEDQGQDEDIEGEDEDSENGAESESGEQSDDQSAVESDSEEAVVTDYLKLNFGSDVPLQSTKDLSMINVPHTLYRIQKSSNISDSVSEIKTSTDLLNFGIDPTLVHQWSCITKQIESKGVLKPVSSAIFPYIATGKDLLFTDSTFANQAELLKLLAFHCVNHALKTRKTVLKNNAKLSSAPEGLGDEMRDQGFTRPKILVLFPFRNVAHKFVHQILKIGLSGSKKQVNVSIFYQI